MAQKNYSHENYDRAEKMKLSSERKFGATFVVVFALLAFAPLLHQQAIRVWALAIAIFFFAITLTLPSVLRPLNKQWAYLGLFLNKLMSPVILAVLFFFIFLPIGLLLKLFKKDILNLTINRHLNSYWIKSDSKMSSMLDQF